MTGSISAPPIEEVYPRAPLRAVAIELYFAPLLDAVARFGGFQRAHASNFPNTYLPDSLESQVLRRRRAATLVSRDATRAIAIGRDLVAVASFAYAGYARFSQWAIPLLDDALEVLAPNTVERVRFVYENDIEFDLDTGRLSDLFNVNLPIATPNGKASRHVHLAWAEPWPNGSVDVRLDCCSEPMAGHGLELRIAADCGGPDAPAEYKPIVDETHRIARLTFERLITDNFREQLREPHDA